MKKLKVLALLTMSLSVLSSIPAFAAGWQKNDTGWWWQEDNGSYPVSTWKWLDGNKDGIAECYYFDASGYMKENTTVDGWTVNSDGAWTVDGVVQTKQVGTENMTYTEEYGWLPGTDDDPSEDHIEVDTSLMGGSSKMEISDTGYISGSYEDAMERMKGATFDTSRFGGVARWE